MAEAILIIDDYADDAKWLELVLRQAGVVNPIHIAHSAYEAVSYIQGEFPFSNRTNFPLPKIIFLDLKLPGVDGFEFLSWLKAQNKLELFTVFVLSGLEDMPSIRKAYTMGATSFLSKPARNDDILNLIHWAPAHWELAKPLPLQAKPDTVPNPGLVPPPEPPGGSKGAASGNSWMPFIE